MKNCMKINKVVSVDSIYSGFENTYESGWSFPGEQHDFWEFVYVVEGTLEVVKDDRIYELPAGYMTFYGPMVFHGIRPTKNAPAHIIIMSFELSGKGYEKIANGAFNVGKTENSLIQSALSAYLECLKYENSIKTQVVANKLEELILILLETQTSRTVLQKTTGTHNYRLIVNTLNENVYKNLCAEEIAACCNMSVANLKKTFKRYSGRGVMSYYNNLRSTKAKVLINDGKSMAEISEIMNYSSQYYFSVSFKKHAGMTPTEFKKKMLEGK